MPPTGHPPPPTGGGVPAASPSHPPTIASVGPSASQGPFF
uniref:Uncharacterized protein n=1 Tax=Arundo donax TaxID=35708 RepID=A0A0A9H7W8_ARUDO